MRALEQDFIVRCLMCSAEAGEIVAGRFRPAWNTPRSLQRHGGMPRCSRCGGSLYLEPAESRGSVTPATREVISA